MDSVNQNLAIRTLVHRHPLNLKTVMVHETHERHEILNIFRVFCDFRGQLLFSGLIIFGIGDGSAHLVKQIFGVQFRFGKHHLDDAWRVCGKFAAQLLGPIRRVAKSVVLLQLLQAADREFKYFVNEIRHINLSS